MMKCRHNFCVHCFKNRFMISRKKDGKSVCPVCNVAIIDKKESKNTVSFAPLPPKIRDKRCRTCSEVCKSINKCKHCKNKFCEACWTNHVNDLKDELNNINGDLQILATKFEDKINNFRDKANEVIEFINRDIEAKINELYKKRENRIKKIERIVAAEETSVDDIRQRMQKVQIDVKEQDTSYATLSDNEEKIKTFLNLQQRAAEIMATVAIWESELNDIQTELRKVNDDKAFIRRNAGPLYKRRTFTPKVIVNRDIVHRPSALAIDSWRNNIITTCPGSGQVVILDRKFKLVRRIRHEEMIAPQGVTFLQMHDEIYVTDKWKHCIFVFNHKGDLVHRIGSKGNAESELCSPEGITFHPERSVLYIADTGNNRVQILEKDGTYLNTLGPKNKRTRGTVTFQSYKTDPIASQLNQPTDVAVTVTRVVVADSGNHKVKIFNHDGEILQSIGGIGTANGLFRSPEVLKIDEKGYIIVGDAENGRVQIFTPEGKFLRMLGAKKKQGHKFAWVSGLLVTNNYDILVSDSKANFIYLF
ncbi:uncharacterized protein LOC105429977 [Pogonomyrmex barbatus]|uniref:Uncharacterized protein LOC105429977 n=1 Tax=Pogonomyrmex barbatus TaxID=144034 RepID=A0A6I9WG48_9HYME|nr:uncharacterized protein LOC105429977 [Pogonomyrmex barbatus]